MQGNANPLAYKCASEVNDHPHRLYTADEVLDLALAAYKRGRFDGDILEARASWSDHREPHLTREQRVAARLAEMESGHAALNRELGRPNGYRYRGGPVDWETGLPAGSPCAWLRRQRAPVTASPTPRDPARPRRHLRSVA
jgi:hypothetical protein